MKFKAHQRVVCPQFLMNGTRMDINGVVQRYVFNTETKENRVEVQINGVFVLLPEERLVDYEQFWDEMRKKEIV